MDSNFTNQNLQPSPETVWTSNPHLKTLLLVLIFLFLLSGIGLTVLKVIGQNYREQIYSDAVVNLPIHKITKDVFDGRLQVDVPKSGAVVSQTFITSGKAQDWFEGNINIKVYDDDGHQLYEGNTIATDNYGKPGPFTSQINLNSTSTAATGVIYFDDYSAKDGKLVYEKAIKIKFAVYDPNLLSK